LTAGTFENRYATAREPFQADLAALSARQARIDPNWNDATLE
jgi:hypothetical protein